MKLVKNLARTFTSYLDNSEYRRCRRRALKNALAAFESSHRPWVEAHFDLHFLTGRGAEALEANDAQALAQAWTSQFRYRDEARRDDDVRRLVLAAATFLELLKRAEAVCASGLRHQQTSEIDALTFGNLSSVSTRRSGLNPSTRDKGCKRQG